MMSRSAKCPECGVKIPFWRGEIECEAFGDFTISQTLRFTCGCGSKFRVTNVFKLYNTLYDTV